MLLIVLHEFRDGSSDRQFAGSIRQRDSGFPRKVFILRLVVVVPIDPGVPKLLLPKKPSLIPVAGQHMPILVADP